MRTFPRGFMIALVAYAGAGLLIEPALANEDAPFSRKLRIDAVAVANDRVDYSSSEDIAINSLAAVQRFGQLNLPFNPNFQDVQISDAYTLKPDGQKISVSPDAILKSSLPNAPQLGLFLADQRVDTIVFPNVAIGDHVHYGVRVHAKAAQLPGGFQLIYAYPPSGRFDDVVISLTAPENLAVQKFSRNFKEKDENAGDGHTRYLWTLEPQPYRADEPNSTSSFDRDPVLLVSSYKSQDDIGRSFLAGAEPKTEVTPSIQRLAQEITTGKQEPREQAQAIYDWVSTHIRYMAIFLGQGGIVPHDANTVLEAGYGDCKDHTTLMRALLRARGIEADYALINIAPIYDEFPVSSYLYDHVILYLPVFGLYADPTSSVTSFGDLPAADAGKPVLRTGRSGVVTARTPSTNPFSDWTKATTSVDYNASGHASGKTEVVAAGSLSNNLRELASQAQVKGADALIHELFTNKKWRGEGTLDKSDPTDHAQPFRLSTQFELADNFWGPGSRNHVIPAGPEFVPPPYGSALAVVREGRTQPFVCHAQKFSEEVSLNFPYGHLPRKTPQNVSVQSPLASYEASYQQDGQTLHIARTFVLDVPTSVCTPDIALQMQDVLTAASADMSTRLELVSSKSSDE